ncbi:hypothetical protein AJ80_02885 [Polytolypa hystricis UAMH7299]|uniref:Threonine/serine exporter-like N-terminal domain-containing protein n=1 Tax=Polytolypa hystricis (strain UAMH7299) TaxID=1447883 RepID=A0A2B7YPX5_POLH7|nr:hypothetical protein AJ80_02885 [Polytolypa hystricis UAMH7299]
MDNRYFRLQDGSPVPGPSTNSSRNSPAGTGGLQTTALNTPAPTPAPSPEHSPRPSLLHSRSRSAGGVDDIRPRLMSHVKFSVASDDSNSDTEGLEKEEHRSDEKQLDERVEFPKLPEETYKSESGGDYGIGEQQSPPPDADFYPPLGRMNTPADQEKIFTGGRRRAGTGEKRKAIHTAYNRAQRLASVIRRPSNSTSQRKRATGDGDVDDPSSTDLEKQATPDDIENEYGYDYDPYAHTTRTAEAHELVRNITQRGFEPLSRVSAQPSDLRSGQVTPFEERDPQEYVQPPTHYRGGILSTLLKLQDSQREQRDARRDSRAQSLSVTPPRPALSREGSYTKSTPRRQKWYDKSAAQSTSSLSGMRNLSSATLTGGEDFSHKSRSSGGLVGAARKIGASKPRLEDEIRITVHIAEILSRQRYLVKLCRALMNYGAPTHRLEEYMRMTARVLEIDGQFLYIPGCMIVSFDDATTHTTEVKLVRATQGVDLGRFADVHEIYKEVVHDVIGVEEAMQRLDEIMHQKPRYNKWWLVLFYGCASATVGPFAFSARPIDMPIAFILGSILGLLQHILSPRSVLYANVFEITAAVVTSFLARAFGSIPHPHPSHGGGGGDGAQRLFCFSALAQSSIALILPGFSVLCGSLELQSRNLVAGSIRMVYAIIYSLFLGFGIMIGTALYGLMDGNATSEYTCPASPITNPYLNSFPFVLLFTLCLILANQGKWKQMPMMLIISFAGYVVNFFSARRFAWNTQIANALGAFVIGVMGNLYSRLHHGLAAAAILPGIFVQVPSGLAASGSLVSGLTFADQLTGNKSAAADITSYSDNFLGTGNMTAESLAARIGANKVYGNMVFDIGYGMVQVAIAITVGLFLAALVVYPYGKRRSGLFSF